MDLLSKIVVILTLAAGAIAHTIPSTESDKKDFKTYTFGYDEPVEGNAYGEEVFDFDEKVCSEGVLRVLS
jgi:hypothetical protein